MACHDAQNIIALSHKRKSARSRPWVRSGRVSVLEAAGEVGYFSVVKGAGCLLVDGSDLVGDVLDAFVLEPAG